MAEAGYICLAFDAAYQGASEGEPRNTDKPAHRIDDIRRAADILLQYPGVDANRVGILGIAAVAAIRWQRYRPTSDSRRSLRSACSIRDWCAVMDFSTRR